MAIGFVDLGFIFHDPMFLGTMNTKHVAVYCRHKSIIDDIPSAIHSSLSMGTSQTFHHNDDTAQSGNHQFYSAFQIVSNINVKKLGNLANIKSNNYYQLTSRIVKDTIYKKIIRNNEFSITHQMRILVFKKENLEV